MISWPLHKAFVSKSLICLPDYFPLLGRDWSHSHVPFLGKLSHPSQMTRRYRGGMPKFIFMGGVGFEISFRNNCTASALTNSTSMTFSIHCCNQASKIHSLCQSYAPAQHGSLVLFNATTLLDVSSLSLWWNPSSYFIFSIPNQRHAPLLPGNYRNTLSRTKAFLDPVNTSYNGV